MPRSPARPTQADAARAAVALGSRGDAGWCIQGHADRRSQARRSPGLEGGWLAAMLSPAAAELRVALTFLASAPFGEEAKPPVSSTPAHPFAGFGANEWLVDEMYQQYLKDPSSVDKAWWDFFADYSPPTRPRQLPRTGNRLRLLATAGSPVLRLPPSPRPSRSWLRAPRRQRHPTLPPHRALPPHPACTTSAPHRSRTATARAAPAVRVEADEIAAAQGRCGPNSRQHGGQPRTYRPRPACATSPPSSWRTTGWS